MGPCDFCPRRCASRPGFCGAGELPAAARAALHMWEEPPISGVRGAGTVFFSGCNLRCVFCQNHDISNVIAGEECGEERLVELFYSLAEQGAHNIDLVTPTPHASTIASAIERAKKQGFSLPFVWNSNAYESVEMLKRLEGLVDIYLPDMKYATDDRARRYSGAPGYPQTAKAAILEMWRQKGSLIMNADGVAASGTLIRHLVLPGCVDEARKVIDFAAEELGKSASLSLMSQYTPMHRVTEHPEKYPFLNRRVTKREYGRAVGHALEKGLTNVYLQSRASASSAFTPAFDGTGL